MAIYIDMTAIVSPRASIGEGTSIWHHSQIREEVQIGRDCILGKRVFVDANVSIGNNVKIQNQASLCQGVIVEDGVIIGPNASITNKLWPEAIDPEGDLRWAEEWRSKKTVVRRGASLGANSTVCNGIVIGEWAMVSCGSVVTRDVPAHGLVMGNPARLQGFVCSCGNHLTNQGEDRRQVAMWCSRCEKQIIVAQEYYSLLFPKELAK